MDLPETFVEVCDFYYVPYWQQPWFGPVMAVLAVLATVLLVAICIVIKKRYAQTVQLSAHERALQELTAIRPKGELAPAALRGYYGALTRILKQYLSARYDWQLLSRTDRQVYDFLSCSENTSEAFDKSIDQAHVAQLFMRAQEMKFAPQVVSQQAVPDWNFVVDLVTRTAPEATSHQ